MSDRGKKKCKQESNCGKQSFTVDHVPIGVRGGSVDVSQARNSQQTLCLACKIQTKLIWLATKCHRNTWVQTRPERNREAMEGEIRGEVVQTQAQKIHTKGFKQRGSQWKAPRFGNKVKYMKGVKSDGWRDQRGGLALAVIAINCQSDQLQMTRHQCK